MKKTNLTLNYKNVWILIILLLSTLSVSAEPLMLQQMADEFEENGRLERSQAVEYANRMGIPIREEFSNGQIIEIQKIENGIPLYYTTYNEDAATSTRTNHLWSNPFSVTGNGYDRLGEWDGGAVRGTHNELTGRVTQVDATLEQSTSNHATHVAGTLIASGQVPAAKGMAHQATLLAYDWTNDESEMAIAAAGGMEVSNHSYGFIAGWYTASDDSIRWYGDTSISQNEAYRFGFYDSNSGDWDAIAYNAPNYLIVKSAGNDRNDTAPVAGTAHSHGSSGTFTDTHNNDGFDNGGYDTIGSGSGSAKNVLTVGAVNDVANYSSPNDVSMSSFSGWGPVDDGRIKPDIVANGVSVYSSVASSDSAYSSYNGTSMASPNVTGSIALLQQYYGQTHSNNSMRSATLKALVLHTADEVGTNIGPDYQSGWGLLNAKKAAEAIEEDSIMNTIGELSLSNNSTYTRDITIGGGLSSLKITIVWTDPAGSPVSASLDPSDIMLVNDLDLKVTKGATTYFPWKLDKNNPANAATNNSENNVDNVEQVYS